jgi:hypothetical protein
MLSSNRSKEAGPMSVPHPTALPGFVTPARTTRPKRNRNSVKALLASARDLWEGDSFEPGDDWLTRVEPRGQRRQRDQ